MEVTYLGAHYHKVDSLLWLEVYTWLSRCVVARLEQGSDSTCVHLNLEMSQHIMDFCEQMDTAYLHPRRDSAHVRMLQSRYRGFAAPVNHYSQSCLAKSPAGKKRLPTLA